MAAQVGCRVAVLLLLTLEGKNQGVEVCLRWGNRNFGVNVA